MKLRSYQKSVLKQTLAYLHKKRGNPVIAMPTGTGKSIIIAALIRYFSEYKNKRVLVLTHVKELIQQNYRQLFNYYRPSKTIGIYSAGIGKRDTTEDIIFAGIASIYDKTDQLGVFDYIIVDECHLIPDRSNTMYQKALNQFKLKNKSIRIIGLSATPYRLNSGLLTEGTIFDDICHDSTQLDSFNWYIDHGYLSNLITKETDEKLDVSKVHIRGGEYMPKELQQAVDKISITKAALKEATIKGANRDHWLVFSTGLDHSRHIAAELNRLGIKAATIDGKMSNKERSETLMAFTYGSIRALVNAQLLTTGFDFPAIDLIIMLRPMCSPGLWVQTVGRGTRPAPYKQNCLVLDFAGNTKRLGPINDVVVPDKKRNGRGKGRNVFVKVCQKCKSIVHATTKICPDCGNEFPAMTRLEKENDERDIIKKETEKIWFDVDRLYAKANIKAKSPPSLMLIYQCGKKQIREWLCFEHVGFASFIGSKVWREVAKTVPPKTVQEALNRISEFKKPKQILVRMDNKYPKILKRSF